MYNNTNISLFGKSDMGRVRTNNEDAFVAQQLWDDHSFLAIAIDGVGGYEGGEVAADMARRIIPEFLMASPNGERIELLKQAVTAANNAIYEERETNAEYSQMSCVLTAALIDTEQRQINMAHVGDTRLYGFRHGKLNKLSHDHSLVGYREEAGDLTEEEAMHHPQRNVIGRDVGSERHRPDDEDFIETQIFPLLPNTTLLLCSDGLTDLVTSSDIIRVLDQDVDLEEKASALIDAALDAGGKDNVTVVLFEYRADEEEEEVTVSETRDGNQEVYPNEDPIIAHPSPEEDFPDDEIREDRSKCGNTIWKCLACLLLGFLLGGAVAYWRMTVHPVTTIHVCTCKTPVDTSQVDTLTFIDSLQTNQGRDE